MSETGQSGSSVENRGSAHYGKRAVLASLVVWQVAMLTVAGIGPWLRPLSAAPELNPEQLRFLASFEAPSPGQIDAARVAVHQLLGQPESMPVELMSVHHLPDGNGSDAETRRRGASFHNILVELGKGDITAALELRKRADSHGSRNWKVEQALAALQPAPNAFRLRLVVADELTRGSASLYDERRSTALYYWVLDSATNDAESATVADRLLGLVSAATHRAETYGEMYATSIARLCRDRECEPQTRCHALSRVAGGRLAEGEWLVASNLYLRAADICPSDFNSGKYLFDSASTFQAHGYSLDARWIVESRLVPSATALEPGAAIFPLARGAQHDASRLVAAIHSTQWNYPAAFIWFYQGTTKYPPRSSCGNCQWELEAEQARDRRGAALRAGPVFLIIEFMRFPWSNRWVWALAIAAWYMRRRQERVRKALPESPP